MAGAFEVRQQLLLGFKPAMITCDGNLHQRFLVRKLILSGEIRLRGEPASAGGAVSGSVRARPLKRARRWVFHIGTVFASRLSIKLFSSTRQLLVERKISADRIFDIFVGIQRHGFLARGRHGPMTDCAWFRLMVKMASA